MDRRGFLRLLAGGAAAAALPGAVAGGSSSAAPARGVTLDELTAAMQRATFGASRPRLLLVSQATRLEALHVTFLEVVAADERRPVADRLRVMERGQLRVEALGEAA